MDQKSSLLDRSYQNEVLAFLLKDYPEYEHTDAFCSDLLIKNDLKYYANLMYLEMHELIEDGPSCKYSVSGQTFFVESTTPRLTAKGVDFILDDGGLSAILNIQTVKLHQDTIKDLLMVAVQSASISEDKKESFADQIKRLPLESLKDLLSKLAGKGIDAILNNADQLTDLLL